MNLFKFLGSGDSGDDKSLPRIFPLAIKGEAFSSSDIVTTYQKILTDTFERTHGLNEVQESALWDNCVRSESGEGLVTMLAKAMAEKADLFVVYKASVLRRATPSEAETIKTEYDGKAESKGGVWISFEGYRRTEMLNIYSALEYCVLASLNKSMNVAKSIQIKINDLRASTALNDSDVAFAQMIKIAKALAAGEDVGLDAKDFVEVPKIDMSPTEKAMAFLDAKKAFHLSLPLSYISGEQTTGIGSTGEADSRAVERGLKQYFVSIARPALKAIFNADVKFKSQDVRQMTSALDTLQKLDISSDDLLPRARKIELVARMFDLDPKEIDKELKAQKPKPVDAPPTTESVVERTPLAS